MHAKGVPVKATSSEPLSRPRTVTGLFPLALAALLLTSCSGFTTFSHRWKIALRQPFPADAIQGPWVGQWHSDSNGRGGALRCLLEKKGKGYLARFHATYAKIFHFTYSAPLSLEVTNGEYQLVGHADLGWWGGGVYHYNGLISPTRFTSTYRSKYDHGTFQLHRPSDPPGSWLAHWRKSHPVWFGVQLSVISDASARALIAELPKLAARGINALVIEVDYHFAFDSHPELRMEPALSKKVAAQLARACRKNGIRPIPLFECLGHQSWSKTTFPLLARYPSLDETPGKFPNNKGIYCRSWCPQNPKVYQLIFPLIDEIADAFSADAFHVGMDEVFFIGSKYCPRCHGEDPAKLFALAVNRLHDHIVGKRKMEMLMWGDRFLSAKKTGYGKSESSANGTAPAIDHVPKDIILCDWHYEKRSDYPSIPILLKKGFRVWPSGWKNVEATRDLIRSEQQHHSPRMLGHLCTTWGAVKVQDLADWPPVVTAAKLWKLGPAPKGTATP